MKHSVFNPRSLITLTLLLTAAFVAFYRRVGETTGDTVEIRRHELLNTYRTATNVVCEVVPLDNAGGALIWDADAWSTWNAWWSPTDNPYSGILIRSVEVAYQGQTGRMNFLNDELDNGPVLRAICLASYLWSQGRFQPWSPTPST